MRHAITPQQSRRRPIGFNDDACGLQSTVTWTATFTGQLRVLVDQYICAKNAICAPLNITCTPPPNG
ncbi:MAG: hypothetical protein IPL52_17840 [Flavobacteriales bacterium]|nr:hypothetical protein [Flavobacteriales bacterium]